MNTYEIQGGNGLGIIVRVFGNPDGKPILFIHGLMQCGLCWSHQVKSDLADEFRLLCMDIRPGLPLPQCSLHQNLMRYFDPTTGR